MADEVKIPISLPGAGQAAADAKKVADGLGNIGTAAGKAATGAKSQGSESEKASGLVEQLASRSGEAREAIEGLDRATQGGAQSVFGLAKAFQAFSTGLRVNPFTFLAGVALGVAPVLWKLAKDFTGIGTAAKDAANDAETALKHMEGVASTAAALGQRSGSAMGSALEGQLKTIQSEADKTIAKLRSIAQIRDELQNEHMALDIARVKAGGGTELEKAEKIFGIRQAYEYQSVSNKIIDAQAEEDAVIKAASAAQKAYESASKDLQRQKVELQKTTGQQGERARLEQQIAKEDATIATQSRRLALNPLDGTAPQIGADIDAARARQQAAREQLSKLPTQDELVRRIAESINAIDSFSKKLETAGEKAVAASARANEATQTRMDKVAALEELEPVANERRKLEATVEFGAANEKDMRSIQESGREVGRALRDTLGEARFTPEPFRGGFHDATLQERARSETDARNARNASAFKGAIKNARDIAAKLGDGMNDDAEVRQLEQLLDQIGNQIDRNTRSQLGPVLQALKNFDHRMSNLEGQTRASRR